MHVFDQVLAGFLLASLAVGLGCEQAPEPRGAAGNQGMGGHLAQIPQHRRNFVLCENGTCPDGLRCFQLTRELGICDPPEIEGEATECTSDGSTSDGSRGPPDECGCLNGGGAGGAGSGSIPTPPCGAGEVCRVLSETCSCLAYRYNACVETACSTEADCPDGAVCIPSSLIIGPRCFWPACRGDSDCTGSPDRRCRTTVYLPYQAGDDYLSSIRCE